MDFPRRGAGGLAPVERDLKLDRSVGGDETALDLDDDGGGSLGGGGEGQACLAILIDEEDEA